MHWYHGWGESHKGQYLWINSFVTGPNWVVIFSSVGFQIQEWSVIFMKEWTSLAKHISTEKMDHWNMEHWTSLRTSLMNSYFLRPEVWNWKRQGSIWKSRSRWRRGRWFLLELSCSFMTWVKDSSRWKGFKKFQCDFFLGTYEQRFFLKWKGYEEKGTIKRAHKRNTWKFSWLRKRRKHFAYPWMINHRVSKLA